MDDFHCSFVSLWLLEGSRGLLKALLVNLGYKQKD